MRFLKLKNTKLLGALRSPADFFTPLTTFTNWIWNTKTVLWESAWKNPWCIDAVSSDIPLLLSKKSMGEAKIKLDLENSIPAIFGQQITLLVVPLNIIVFL